MSTRGTPVRIAPGTPLPGTAAAPLPVARFGRSGTPPFSAA